MLEMRRVAARTPPHAGARHCSRAGLHPFHATRPEASFARGNRRTCGRSGAICCGTGHCWKCSLFSVSQSLLCASGPTLEALRSANPHPIVSARICVIRGLSSHHSRSLVRRSAHGGAYAPGCKVRGLPLGLWAGPPTSSRPTVRALKVAPFSHPRRTPGTPPLPPPRAATTRLSGGGRFVGKNIA